jgi:hypothetical protein
MDKTATYAEDVFIWSKRQAALLRDLARAGVALPNELDLPNIAEEIEDVGRSELNSVLSHLEEMLIHAIKAASRPDAEACRQWLNEIGVHRRNAERRFTPGMRQLIDLGVLWRRAIRLAGDELARFGEAMAPMPQDVPFTLDELLDIDVSPEALIGRLTGNPR